MVRQHHVIESSAIKVRLSTFEPVMIDHTEHTILAE